MKIEEEDLEFEALVQKFCPIVSVTKYVNFDDIILVSNQWA